MKRIILVSGLWIFICNLVFGFQDSQQNSETGRDTQIIFDEIVITASRHEERKVDRPESIATLDSAGISLLSPSSAPDVLAIIPGVWMQKTNLGGGSPFIRGLTGYQTLILIDGIRLNNSTFRSGPNQYLNTIDPYIISRVEVVRGSGAVQYGSDAIGGTINIMTKSPRFGNTTPSLTGRLHSKVLSSNMEYGGRTDLEYLSEKVWMYGGVSGKNMGNLKAGGQLGVLSPTGYKEGSVDIKAAVKIGKNGILTAGLQYLRQTDVPLYHKLVNGDFATYLFDPQQRLLSYVKFHRTYSSKYFKNVRWMLTYQKSDEQRKKQRSSESEIVTDHDNVETLGASMEIHSQPISFWNISTTIEWYVDWVNSATQIKDEMNGALQNIRGLYPDNSFYSNFAISSTHNFLFGPLKISPGLRFNLIQLKVEDPIFGVSNLKPTALIGNLGLVYRLNPNLNFVASLGTGFRAPNINDVSSLGIADFRYEIPNYNLNPEKSTHFDVGIKSLFEKLELSLQGYVIKLQGLIANVPYLYNGQDSIEELQVYRRTNINEAILKGIEMESRLQFGRRWLAFGNLIYTHGQNQSKDEPMRRIPPFNGRFGIGHHLKKVIFRVDWNFAGKQNRLSGGDKSDDRIAEGGTPGWQVVNLTTSLDMGGFQIGLGAQNLFDQPYRTHGSGIDAVGRSIWLSVRTNLFNLKF